MKIIRRAHSINRSHEECATAADLRICFSYAHTDAPLEGTLPVGTMAGGAILFVYKLTRGNVGRWELRSMQ
jgi:hypothetical protein